MSDGDPGPDMPDTLYRLPLEPGGRTGRDECRLCWPLASLTCVLRAGSDCCASDGGVTEPLEGAVPWLTAPSLEVSVELSVRKLALDRRRSPFKNAMALRYVAAAFGLESTMQGQEARQGELSMRWADMSKQRCRALVRVPRKRVTGCFGSGLQPQRGR